MTDFDTSNPLFATHILLQTSGLALKYAEARLFNVGITATQFLLLTTLQGNGASMTPTKISQASARSKDSITTAVDGLAKSGLVRRVRNIEDRRSIDIKLTPKGKEFCHQLLQPARQLASEMMSCFQREDIEEFLGLLQLLQRSLNGKTPEKKEPTKIGEFDTSSPLLATHILLQTSDLALKHAEARLSTVGITATQFLLLTTLQGNGASMTPTKISHASARSKDSITTAVDGLAKSGFVRRVRNTKDRRSTDIKLTPKGKEFCHQLVQPARQLAAEMMSCFQSEDIKGFSRLLQLLHGSLNGKTPENGGNGKNGGKGFDSRGPKPTEWETTAIAD